MVSEKVIKDSSFPFATSKAIKVLLTNFSTKFARCFAFASASRHMLQPSVALCIPSAHNSQSSTLTFNHFTSDSSLSFTFFSYLAQHTEKSLNFCVCRQWEIIFVKRLAGC
jgi:hypothetical protein